MFHKNGVEIWSGGMFVTLGKGGKGFGPNGLQG